MITCATWADIFLNEGFATWGEAHWTENQGGYVAYMNEMKGNADYYLSQNPHWAISSPSWAVTTPNVNTLFNYAITYMKGSCVLHMLRYSLGDAVFFPALKAYATDTVDFKFKTATIEDFKSKMESESGQQQDWFFDQWIYKPDHPVYRNVYGISQGNNGKWLVSFSAKQQEQAFLPYFQMPLELKISFNNGTDTIVRFFNSFNNQVFVFEFDKKPLMVTFDPNNEILLKEGTTVVGLDEVSAASPECSLTATPNPFKSRTLLSLKIQSPEFITIELYNSTGIKIKTLSEKYQKAGDFAIEFEGENLKDGIYFVVVKSARYRQAVKIIKTS
jgi:aminopeptidase N